MSSLDFTNEVLHIASGEGGDLPGQDLVGFKAWNLARMTRAGLNVPPAFVLGTSWCKRWLAGLDINLDSSLPMHVRWLESKTGRFFGGTRRPLLLSVRSGAPVSMPGMMDTLLDIGLCDASVDGFMRATGNPSLVWDAYRRLIRSFAEVVGRLPAEAFDVIEQEWIDRYGVDGLKDLDYAALRELTQESRQLYRRMAGEDFPQDPREQLYRSVMAVFESWCSDRAVAYRKLNQIDDHLGTAVTVQAMVFGNGGGTSGSGVGFTRDPGNGQHGLYVDFQFNAQGEDVVSGRRSVGGGLEGLNKRMPAIVRELENVAEILERAFGDMQEFEFTVEDGALYLLQTRSGKRTPWAALVIAIEMADEGLISRDEAIERIQELDPENISRRRSLSISDYPSLAAGIGTGAGLVSGCVALGREGVSRIKAAGQPAILVSEEIATDDIDAIAHSDGVLSRFGGRTSHAAVVARQMDKVCVVGCDALRCDKSSGQIRLGDRILNQGDMITLDGDSGVVFLGEVSTETERPEQWLRRLELMKQA